MKKQYNLSKMKRRKNPWVQMNKLTGDKIEHQALTDAMRNALNLKLFKNSKRG